MTYKHNYYQNVIIVSGDLLAKVDCRCLGGLIYLGF